MSGAPEAPQSPADAYALAAQRVQALLRSPGVFGPDVRAVECIETHISWVLLAGGFAYKFKKPLLLDFLDFSTQGVRRRACEEELRINRRTAPALYLFGKLIWLCVSKQNMSSGSEISVMARFHRYLRRM